jgi:LPXTG-motif cell wall-anchored protein
VAFGRTGSTSSWAFLAGLLALIGVCRRRMG